MVPAGLLGVRTQKVTLRAPQSSMRVGLTWYCCTRKKGASTAPKGKAATAPREGACVRRASRHHAHREVGNGFNA